VTATRAIVFDLDDTLYLERDYAFSGFDAVAAELGSRMNPPFDLAARMRELFSTPDRGRVFNVLLDELQVDDPDVRVKEMVSVFRNHRPKIKLCPDADQALIRLRPTCKLGLITDGFAVTQHAKIDALALRERIDEIIVTDDLGREFWKPHPRAFEEMQTRLGLPPHLCTYVADNPAKDFTAPHTLGWQTVRIARPEGIHASAASNPQGRYDRSIVTLDVL
jgi:putative hydrolase of the HAD superfamily